MTMRTVTITMAAVHDESRPEELLGAVEGDSVTAEVFVVAVGRDVRIEV